ncbi:MAG TPA: hypothetical protein VEY71_12890, partial [Chitinophagales bacterium]|nr:hypothetical protein [Chitinophagales bacterium]
PFRLAIEKQVPIVPVTFIDNWRHLYVEKKLWARPGLLRTVVHPPVSTQGMTMDDLEKLMQTVYNVIDAELQKHATNRTVDSPNFAAHASRRQAR